MITMLLCYARLLKACLIVRRELLRVVVDGYAQLRVL